MGMIEDSTLTVYSCGTRIWRNNNGQPNRQGGPARIWIDGDEEWLVDGQYHRIGGPARTLQNFGQYWYVNGIPHRTDGPAICYFGGGQYWFIQNQDITDKVNAWMKARDVSWPWDESTQVEFQLTWT